MKPKTIGSESNKAGGEIFEIHKQDLMGLVFAAYGEEKETVYRKALRRYTQSCLYFAECTRNWPEQHKSRYCYGIDMKNADWKMSQDAKDRTDIGLYCEWAYKKKARYIISRAEFFYVRIGHELMAVAVSEDWDETGWQNLRRRFTGFEPPESYWIL